MLIMCGSFFTMIMSILKTISMGAVANSAVGTPDVQYSSSPQLIYGFAEQSVVIIMGCIPILRAIMKLELSKLSLVRRFYAYMGKSSTDGYAVNRYTDLDTDSHNLNHIHRAKGTTKTSVGTRDTPSVSRDHDGINLQLPFHGQITRTDGYTVTYGSKEPIPTETV